MLKRLLPLAFALCLLLTGCDVYGDAASVLDEWRAASEESAVSAPVSSEDAAPVSRPEVKAALGVVLNGTFAGYPDESVPGWLLRHFPDGDWSSTGDAVDYFATVELDGEPVEAHFGFTVDLARESWALEACTLGGDSYAEDELPDLLGDIGE